MDVPQTDSWVQVGDSRGDFQRLTWLRDLRKSVRTEEEEEMEWSGKVSFKGRAAVALKDLSSCVIITISAKNR